MRGPGPETPRWGRSEGGRRKSGLSQRSRSRPDTKEPGRRREGVRGAQGWERGAPRENRRGPGWALDLRRRQSSNRVPHRLREPTRAASPSRRRLPPAKPGRPPRRGTGWLPPGLTPLQTPRAPYLGAARPATHLSPPRTWLPRRPRPPRPAPGVFLVPRTPRDRLSLCAGQAESRPVAPPGGQGRGRRWQRPLAATPLEASPQQPGVLS